MVMLCMCCSPETECCQTYIYIYIHMDIYYIRCNPEGKLCRFWGDWGASRILACKVGRSAGETFCSKSGGRFWTYEQWKRPGLFRILNQIIMIWYILVYIYIHTTVQKSGEPVTFPKTNSEFTPWKPTGTQKERIPFPTIMAFRGKPLDCRGVHHLEDFIHPRYLAGFPLWTVSFGLWLDQGNPTVGW